MRQQGVTLIGALMYLVISMLGLLTVFKLGPVYMENYSVIQVMNSLQSDDDNRKQILASVNKKYTVRKIMERYLQVNSVRGVSLNDLEMNIQADGYEFSLGYDRRLHFVGNIDVVVAFDNSVVVKRE